MGNGVVDKKNTSQRAWEMGLGTKKYEPKSMGNGVRDKKNTSQRAWEMGLKTQHGQERNKKKSPSHDELSPKNTIY